MKKKGQITFRFGQDGIQRKENQLLAEDSGLAHKHQKQFTSVPPLPLHKSDPDPRKKRAVHLNGVDTFNTYTIHKKKRVSFPSIGRIKDSSKVLLVALAAIGIGVLFGLTVLFLFSSLNPDEQTEVLANHTVQRQEAGGTKWNQGKAQEGSKNQKDTDQSKNPSASDLEIPSLPYHVVQAGVFSDQEAGKMVAQSLRREGLAAVLVSHEPPYRLYVGISPTKEGAQHLGRTVHSAGKENYVREHRLSENVSVSTETKEDSFVGLGDQLWNLLCSLSVQGLIDPSRAISAKEWEKIQNAHYNLLQSQPQKIGSEAQKAINQAMMKHLSTAVNALETYRTQQHVSYLWQIQQAALNYLQEVEQVVSSGV